MRRLHPIIIGTYSIPTFEPSDWGACQKKKPTSVRNCRIDMDFDFFVEHVLSLSCQGTEAVLLLEAQVCIPTMPRMAESELKLHSAVSSFG